MEEHKCKLCWKSFANGRALGGHMRSHMASLPISLTPSDEENSDSGDDLEVDGEKRVSVADPELSNSVVLQDRESETESPKNPTRKRSLLTRKPSKLQLNQSREDEEEEGSKRRQKCSQVSESWTEAELASSVSDAATTEEDVAFCLVMMSRDRWGRNPWEHNHLLGSEVKDTEDEFQRWSYEKKKKKQTKYFKCETCDKVFKSYQALGGHRASHKKNNGASEPVQVQAKALKVSVGEQQQTESSCRREQKRRNHECSICLRVFASGQALGGHKRSHAAASITPPKESLRRECLIDLNLPAPADDDDPMSSVLDAY